MRDLRDTGAGSDVRIAVDARALLGEGPTWLPQQQQLWYCDIPARRLYRHDPAGGTLAHWEFHAEVGSFAPLRSGTFLLALRDGLWHFDPAGDRRDLLVAAPYDTGSERFNDGKCDPAGRFWVGSIDEPRRGVASLYCFAGGRLERRAGGVKVSNGLAWSPDGTTMYWSDTPTGAVSAFDFDLVSGTMSRQREFARFAPPEEGRAPGGWPDGAAIDAEGCYWVAMFGGGRVLRLSPAGELLRDVRLPALCPTMPCFGGADLRTVYVTTASVRRSAEELERYPDSGCVFSFRVDVPGLPVDFAAPL